MSANYLEPAAAWLNDRIANDPEIGPALFEKLRAEQRKLGLLHGTRPTCSFLRPFILPRVRYEEVIRVAETLAGVFETLTARALSDDALLAELDLTEGEAMLARIDPGYPVLCVNSRLDAFLTRTNFQFLEYNAESPAGLVDQILLEKILFDLPHMKEFLARFPHWRPRPHQRLLRALLETYRAWGGNEEPAHICIVDWKGVSTESEFEVLEEYFESENCPTIIADPAELEYDGHTLTARGFRIDILYKRVIIHEFLKKFDMTHPLARAYADHRVCMANSFRVKIPHKKAGFAILSDPRYEHLFTAEQIACIRLHIPWTRRIREGRTTFGGAEHDLIELLQRERARLVIKPNDDYGGHGVVIGAETAPAQWEQVIAHALETSYVVQERVPVEKVLMPTFEAGLEWERMIVDFDPFLFLNKAEGGLVRLSSSSLCNVSSGGGETALLVLDES